MLRKQGLHILAVLTLGSGLASAARAQFPGGSALVRFDATRKEQTRTYGDFDIYPLAPFTVGGNFANGSSGTQTDFGLLLSTNIGIKPAKARGAVEFGGWYWTKGNASLSQYHVRGFVTPDFGVQFSYLQSSRAPGAAYTAFFVYDLLSQRVNPKSTRRWSIEGGLGGFFDLAAGRSTSSVSMYVQGSYQLYGNLNANAGIWYLRDRSDDLNRFNVGLGYSF